MRRHHFIFSSKITISGRGVELNFQIDALQKMGALTGHSSFG